MAKRIGLLGGTFNPIHVGHMAMAQIVLEQLKLEKVYFVPSALPPHKSVRHLVSAEHRYRMVRAAVRGNPRLAVSDVEIRRGGKSYTIDTVEHFRRHTPRGSKIFFIIGQDSLSKLSTWRQIDELKRKVTFVAVNRPGYRSRHGKVKCLFVTMPGIDIASSYLRQRIRQGKSVKYLVPEAVFRYIEQRKLYKA